MTDFQRDGVDVLIVGSGPAGMSTALHLVKADPAWTGRLIVIDKAVHPREKPCGGGISRLGEQLLAGLGLSLGPGHVPVREMRLVYHDLIYAFRDDPVFRIVRRAEFDHRLVEWGGRQGVVVRQGEAVRDIRVSGDYVEVVTERATLRARVVVAADGSRSVIRQKLGWDRRPRTGRLLEVETAEAAEASPEFQDGLAVLDFTPMTAGLQGYYWDFPSLIQGKPFMNRGIYDSRFSPDRPRAPLKHELRAALERRGRLLDEYPLNGHPLRWFDRRGSYSRPRVLLAGDAAGVDSFIGEGISFALGYGEVAAETIIDAFARHDFSFRNYKRRLLGHRVISQLVLRSLLSRALYSFEPPRVQRSLFRIAPWIVRCISWYDPNSVPINPPRLMRIS
jgi:flavin-dependent dehydrogenase